MRNEAPLICILFICIFFLSPPEVGRTETINFPEMPRWVGQWHLVIPSKGKIKKDPIRTYTYVDNLTPDQKKSYATIWVLYDKSREKYYIRGKKHSKTTPDFTGVSPESFRNSVQSYQIPQKAKNILVNF